MLPFLIATLLVLPFSLIGLVVAVIFSPLRCCGDESGPRKFQQVLPPHPLLHTLYSTHRRRLQTAAPTTPPHPLLHYHTLCLNRPNKLLLLYPHNLHLVTVPLLPLLL